MIASSPAAALDWKLILACLDKIIIGLTPRGEKSALNKNRLDQPAPNKGLLVGCTKWVNRRLPFGYRIQREMGGTGLRAVTTYPTISRQDKVSDFYFKIQPNVDVARA